MAYLVCLLFVPQIQVRAEADSLLFCPVETFFPVVGGGRGGGTASIGDASLSKTNWRGEPALALKPGRRSRAATWWFPNHRPLRLDDWAADKTLRLRLVIGSEWSGVLKLSARWRLKLRQKTESVSGTVPVAPEKWSELLLPLPSTNPAATIDGLTLETSSGHRVLIWRIEVVSLRAARIDPPSQLAFLHDSEIKICGRVIGGARRVLLDISRAEGDGHAQPMKREITTEGGAFFFPLDKGDLWPNSKARIVASVPGRTGPEAQSLPVDVFVFTNIIGRRLPEVSVKQGKLMRDNRPFGFLGFNYNEFNLTFSRRPSFESIARDVATMVDWKIRAVRITMNLGFVEPAPGVFPVDPRWRRIYEKHHLRPEYIDLLDYFVDLAGDNGIYSILDFHGLPQNPERWQTGGLSWAAPSVEEKKNPEVWYDRLLPSLEGAHRWVAEHFKGNSNILAIEVPFNEPHDRFLSVPANYRGITGACARAVKLADPDRLVFAMPAGWGHDNASATALWLRPWGVDGIAPHFYLANGPVPLRPEAKTMRQGWLCRKVAPTFEYSLAAALLPYSSVGCPVYNGEGGEHGAAELLPELDILAATRLMTETGMVQYYAAGLAGHLQWNLWRHPKSFLPKKGILRQLCRRFSPVFDAGPVENSRAEVAIIQNPAAVPAENSHNFACVPFARLALDLHLSPVHYLTDDQIIHTGLARVSSGVEQTAGASANLRYKAVVVDKRNLDERVSRALKALAAPILWVDDAESLEPAALADFLEKAGVLVDRKTPEEIQVIEGPKHLILYRRGGDGTLPVRVFPRLHRRDSFELFGEDGGPVFKGSAEELSAQGFELILPKWQSRIYSMR